VLKATNECLLEIGVDSSSDQLMDKIRILDFEGLTGCIRFDVFGDRVDATVFANPTYPEGGKNQTGTDDPNDLV
jgi:hypothetical protein